MRFGIQFCVLFLNFGRQESRLQVPEFGQSRRWGASPSAADMRRLPVSGPEASLKGSFALHTSAASCPQETFTISAVERQVTERSSRTARGLTAYYSAKGDLAPLFKIGRPCAGYLPLSH